MNALEIHFSKVGDKPPPLEEFTKDGEIIHLADGAKIAFVCLDGGMRSGKPSVAFAFEIPGHYTDAGSVFVIAESTARLFCTAARAIEARYPDLFEE